MKYDYKKYESPLSDDMKDVEIVYKKYLKDKNNNNSYEALKESVYLLSLTLKMANSCGYLNPVTIEEMNDYYWGLLL